MSENAQAKPHRPSCADRIRVVRIAEAGDPDPVPTRLRWAIVDEIGEHCGHSPLKSARLAWGWTVSRAVAAVRALYAEQRPSSCGLGTRSWMEWEAGVRPSPQYQDLVCRLFRTGPVRLGFANDYTPLSVAERERGRIDDNGAIAVDTGDIEWELIMNSAHESSEHAARVEAAGVGTTSIEQLNDDIIALARAYPSASPAALFPELVRVRDRAYWLLDHTRKPVQERNLYLAAGQVCGLLAGASFDLGYPQPATEHARAARAYGEIIGHDELRAWSDGMLATIAFWSRRPSQALRIIDRGFTYAPGGTARVRLLSIAGRASAVQGDVEGTRTALSEADRLRAGDTNTSDLHDRIGGEFGFDVVRQAFCAGTAYLRAGCVADAISACRRTIELYAQLPAAARWPAAEAGAYVDLATAYVLSGDIGAAVDALRPVFALPADRQVYGVVQRLGSIRDALSDPALPKTGRSRALAEQLESFTADAVTTMGAIGA